MLRPHQRGAPRIRQPQLIPPPVIKPWRGKPRSDHALVTMATGEKGAALLEISGPILRRYAERCGLDFHVITGEPGPWPIARKWEVGRFFPHYRRIVWLDADLILHPDCPNLLDVVPEGSFGGFDDWPDIIRADSGRGWLLDECRELARSQRWPSRETDIAPVTFNTGVWVAGREHLPAFLPPAQPFPKRHCVEQNHINFRLAQLGIPTFRLPRELNWQWWVTREPLDRVLPGVMIYHLAGLFGKYPERLEQMRVMKARLWPEL